MSRIKFDIFCETKRSVFFEQSAFICKFSDDASWVILSDIEQRIKAKIEAVGTPLKDWNINIYRGVLTGYNNAFIIDGNKRAELISEDPKSDEIIRPILRGRDIKRYGYDFADLWLINTHNGVKEKNLSPINIADYPAIKTHLDTFFPQLEKRADKGDTPYNLRNCAYMEDFYRPKIVWKRVGSILRFSYDETGCFALDSTCFATGKYLKYLVCFLNSHLGRYLLRDAPQTGTGDLLISVQAIEPLLIPIPNSYEDEVFSKFVNELMSSEQETLASIEKKINYIIYRKFGLNGDEIEFIETR